MKRSSQQESPAGAVVQTGAGRRAYRTLIPAAAVLVVVAALAT